MALIPIPIQRTIKNNQKLRSERKRTIQPTQPKKSAEVVYRNALISIIRRMRADVERELYSALHALESEYTRDNYAITLEQVFKNLRSSYGQIGIEANRIANTFSGQIDAANRDRFYKSINNAVGVDLNALTLQENLGGVLTSAVNQNVNLIKTIPDEFFKKIETIVYQETVRGQTAQSMINQIQNVYSVTENRARLIARDQTSKLNATLTQKRAENLGSDEYVWRTAEDGRVRESHQNNNGVIFRWDDPPKDTGPPGEDIQCRCIAQPIIKI